MIRWSLFLQAYHELPTQGRIFSVFCFLFISVVILSVYFLFIEFELEYRVEI